MFVGVGDPTGVALVFAVAVGVPLGTQKPPRWTTREAKMRSP